MNKSEYNTAPQRELIEGFRLTLENSIKLFRSAEDISTKQYYSVATSLLILAAEEAIKAIALLPRIINFSIEVDYEVKDYFLNHSPKQSAIKNNSNSLSKSFYRIIEIVVKKCENLDLSKNDDEFMRNLHRNIGFINNKIMSFKGIDASDIYNWWEKNQNLKNTGFYVDFKEGKWQSPSNMIDKEKYITSFERVADIVGFCYVSSLLIDDLELDPA